MKRLITLTGLSLLLSQAYSQVPEFVPAEGLVTWWSLENDGTDLSGNGNHLQAMGGFSFESQNEDGRGIEIDGTGEYLACIPFAGVGQHSDHTVSFWTKGDFTDGNFWALTQYNGNPQPFSSLHIGMRNDFCDDPQGWGVVSDFYQGQCTSPCEFSTEWNHWTLTYEHGTGQKLIYRNGTLVADTLVSAYQSNLDQGVLIGGQKYSSYGNVAGFRPGALDDMGVWSRVLSPVEALAVYQGYTFGCTIPEACNYDSSAYLDDGTCEVAGCTDFDACNFVADASCDDGSCDYTCCPGPGCCGEGMYWDWSLEECAITNPADINLDGCVQLNDLLDLLGAYGTCFLWQCGDPLEYQGHAYATVQIGGQCWFAENLRAIAYANGDSIPTNLSDASWSVNDTGAAGIYGQSDAGCTSSSPDIDACDPVQSLAEYGRLYNWFAVNDSRSLCPSEWHVPSDEDWMSVEEFLGMNESQLSATGFRGTNQGAQMKKENGWFGGGNGTNLTGFSGLPGGGRYPDGLFPNSVVNGNWWSSSSNGEDAWFRYLAPENDLVGRLTYDKNYGFSVRCIKDTE